MLTLEQRNAALLEHMGLVHYTVRRNIGLLNRLRLEYEDMVQELTICLLQAIESYDPSRGMKSANYYLKMLQYGVLALNREQSRLCRVAALTARPLIFVNDDGEETEMDIPYYEDFDTELNVEAFLSSLSEREKNVIALRLEGKALADKRQQALLALIKKKAARYAR